MADDRTMSDDADHPGTRPTILVSDRQPVPIDEGAIVELASETLRHEGVGDAELSVSFVDENEMAELNGKYLGEPGPTDVLSFPLDAPDGHEGTRLLGDVVIAPAVAAGNNPQDPGGELRLLLVHGILHLLGYDHEDDEARIEMWSRQEAYSGVRTS
jgi:probable rRNA maturation factor